MEKDCFSLFCFLLLLFFPFTLSVSPACDAGYFFFLFFPSSLLLFSVLCPHP